MNFMKGVQEGGELIRSIMLNFMKPNVKRCQTKHWTCSGNFMNFIRSCEVEEMEWNGRGN